jgi:hypothetical protein
VRIVLIVIGVLVLLVVVFFVADAAAKRYATDTVRARIIEVLGLDASTPIGVDLGPGSILLQAARGSIDTVTVTADRISWGDLTGSARVVATGVPLDSTKPVGTLGIVVTVTEANVAKLAGYLSGITLTKIELTEGVIRASADVTVLFATLPVAVDLLPSAHDGAIAFDPTTIRVGTTQLSVDDLRTNPLIGSLAGDILRSQQVCIASYLPKALVVDGVAVVGSQIQISIRGDGTALGDPGLSTLGTCP